MNQTKLLVTLVIALLMAGGASLLVFQQINQAQRKGSTITLAVAARDLDVGTSLAQADIKQIQWASSQTPKGAILNADEMIGRAVLYPIAENEVLLSSKLAAAGSGAGLPSVIPQGMRAVSIRVDDVVAVAGFVGPGTRVDVLLTGSPGSNSSNKSEALTRTILQNVQVLAAGQKFQPDGQGRAEKVNVVTLLCTTEDAAKVTLAASDGRIQLVLRNPTDTLTPERAASVGRNSLYGDRPQPAPVRAAPPKVVVVAAPPLPPPPVAEKLPEPTTVIVIRAGQISKVRVEESENRGTNQ